MPAHAGYALARRPRIANATSLASANGCVDRVPLGKVSVAAERVEAFRKFRECLRTHVAVSLQLKEEFLKVTSVHGGSTSQEATAARRAKRSAPI